MILPNDIKKEFQPHELLSTLNLDLGRIMVEYDAGSVLHYEFEISAKEFIKYAECDLQQGTTHGYVNALTNAKRAIDCQIDAFLGCFGYLSRLNFPQKVELLQNLSIVSPKIINKVIKTRNLLEHEYKIPQFEQVEDAVDIATLFVNSIELSLHSFSNNFSIRTVVDGVYDEGNLFADKSLIIDFDTNEHRFILSGVIFIEPPTSNSRKAYRIEKSIIKPKEKGYLELINLAFSLGNDLPQKELNQKGLTLIQLLTCKQGPLK